MSGNYKNGLLYGVGISDIPTWEDGKPTASYKAWKSMLEDCYEGIGTYSDCTVVEEWLTHSTFKAWYDPLHFKGCKVNKDMINVGNKVYGPLDCVIVSKSINRAVLIDSCEKGMLTGVARRPSRQGLFQLERDTILSRFIGSKYRGYHKVPRGNKYHTTEAAHNAWCGAKHRYLQVLSDGLHIDQHRREEVTKALLGYVEYHYGAEGKRTNNYGT